MNNTHDTSSSLSGRDKILAILSRCRGTAINICYSIYSIISAEPEAERPILVRLMAESFGHKESSNSIDIESYIPDDRLKNLEEKYGALVNGMLALLFSNKYEDENIFYFDLWESISKNPLLRDDEIKAFAFYYVIIDSRIPYFCLGNPVRMTDEQWKTIQLGMTQRIHRARFILGMNWEQKSEEAGYLLDVLLDDANNRNEQVVIMAQIVSVLRAKSRRIVEALRDKVNG